MATPEQLASYHPQCSHISFLSEFESQRSVEYDPGDEDYYEDVFENHGQAGWGLAFACIVIWLVFTSFAVILCCVPHHWLAYMDFIGIARTGRHWFQRLLGLLFVSGVIVCTVLVTAMSIWGIVQVEQDAKDVVPDAFDFIERTEWTLDSIYDNLTSTVVNGNEIVEAIRLAIREVREDPSTELLAESDIETNETLFEVLEILEEASDDAEEALDTVETEINENLDDVLGGMRDAVGYRDEGEGINQAGRIVVIAAFCLFVFFAVGSTIFSLAGVSPQCTLSWAMIMWFMLIIAFICVSLLDIAREISRESCLYIDTFAVRELIDKVDTDPERTETLLWYYFRPPSNRNLNMTELEELWGYPLTDVVEYLDFAEQELFEGDELRFPYNLGQASTQNALFAVRDLMPQARSDIAYVQDLMEGDTFHNIHADLKNLICCTEYDAVDDVWTSWVVASTFGLVIAVLMTIQALLSLRCGSGVFDGTLAMGRLPTQKVTGYLGPPVAEGVGGRSGYVAMTEIGGSKATTNNPPQSSVAYPTVQMPGSRV